MGSGEPAGQLLDLGSPVQNGADLPGQGPKRLDELAALNDAHPAPEPAQLEGDHGQRGHLAVEGLGAGDPDLGAGPEIHPALDLAGNARAHHVHQPDGGGAPLAGFPHRGQGIGGFSRLGNGNDEAVLVNHRIAVAELGGVFDFAGNPGQLLDQVLADKPGVPGSSAPGNHDPAKPL